MEQGLILDLHFTAFDIQRCFNCVCDHLTITNGDGTTLMEKSCGSTSEGNVVIGGESIGSSLPPPIRSRSNTVNLVFTTDDYATTSMTGWSVTWSAVTPGECQQQGWNRILVPCFSSQGQLLSLPEVKYPCIPCQSLWKRSNILARMVFWDIFSLEVVN